MPVPNEITTQAAKQIKNMLRRDLQESLFRATRIRKLVTEHGFSNIKKILQEKETDLTACYTSLKQYIISMDSEAIVPDLPKT